MSEAAEIGSGSAAAVTGEMKSDRSGTDSIATTGRPPFERPIVTAATTAAARKTGSVLGRSYMLGTPRWGMPVWAVVDARVPEGDSTTRSPATCADVDLFP